MPAKRLSPTTQPAVLAPCAGATEEELLSGCATRRCAVIPGLLGAMGSSPRRGSSAGQVSSSSPAKGESANLVAADGRDRPRQRLPHVPHRPHPHLHRRLREHPTTAIITAKRVRATPWLATSSTTAPRSSCAVARTALRNAGHTTPC